MEICEGLALIEKYFPSLSASMTEQFARLGSLYPEWNAKINVISRRDIDCLYERHILHSLAIAHFLGPLREGTEILDLGCGGGFPGIPLSIVYPHCRFLLLDRIAKKIRVARAIADDIELSNVTFQQGDAGECRHKFDYVVSRAVMPLDGLVKISTRLTDTTRQPGTYPPGVICLKGGDLTQEVNGIRRKVLRHALSNYFEEEFFTTKEIVYVPL